MAKGLLSMEATLPTRIYSARFRRALLFMARETAKDIQADFDLTQETFRKLAKFHTSIEFTRIRGKISVWTTDENYVRLNKGVKGGYKIPKGGPGLLVFPEGWATKTDPERIARGNLKPTDGGPYGDLVFAVTQITAKGFDGRFFDKAIKDLWEKPFKFRVQLAITFPFGTHLALSARNAIRRWKRFARNMATRGL